MALIDDMLAELESVKQALAAPLEGTLDYRGTHNFSEAGRSLAEAGRQAFTDLQEAVEEAIEKLKRLKETSYPEIPSFETEASVLADLDAQILSMTAFRARVEVRSPSATHMTADFTISEQ